MPLRRLLCLIAIGAPTRVFEGARAAPWARLMSGTAPAIRSRWLERMLPFALICAAHVAALWWLATASSRSPGLNMPPAVVGVLLSQITAPKPLPIAPEPQPKPVVRLKATPKPRVPDALPSERVSTAPMESPAAPAAPVAIAMAPAPPEPSRETPEPITPPHADASFLNNPAPAYPPPSRRLREQGRVLIDVYILADGTVGEIKLKRSSGYPRLDKAALDAVYRWRYMPAKRGNDFIAFWHVQPIDFALSP